jgi:CubicO group peptidase (beta-lactamase class C family)
VTTSPVIEQLLIDIELSGLEFHSLAISQAGHKVFEGHWFPYQPEHKHMLFSLSKSFTSIACMFAVQEGLLDLDEKVVDIFRDKLSVAPSGFAEQMQIRHLLAMATGHAEKPQIFEFLEDYTQEFFREPIQHEPGTYFLYNTLATYMAGVVLHIKTGQDLVDYLNPRLFEPLGIDGSDWMLCPKGLRVAGFGLKVVPSAILTFGQFLLQKGQWEGKQLLHPDLVELATQKHVSNGDDPFNDWNQGYGFQFWRCQHGAYRGDGAYGQFMVIHPELQLVVAVTSAINDLQAVLNLIWKHLVLPQPILQKHQAPTLEISRPTGIPEAIEGRWSAEFNGDNVLSLLAMTLNSQGGSWSLTLACSGTEHLFNGTLDHWTEPAPQMLGALDFDPVYNAIPTLSSNYAAWTAPNRFEIKFAFVECPFSPTITVDLGEDEVILTYCGMFRWFGETNHSPIIGKLNG